MLSRAGYCPREPLSGSERGEVIFHAIPSTEVENPRSLLEVKLKMQKMQTWNIVNINSLSSEFFSLINFLFIVPDKKNILHGH